MIADSTRARHICFSATLAGLTLASVVSCASRPNEARTDALQVFPGVRATTGERYVEIDARTTPFFDSFEEGEIFLELIACSPNSREHETLLICDARASHIHAALLLAGFEPGTPAAWTFEKGEMIASPPSGDALTVTLVYTDEDGDEVVVDPADWIVHADTGARPEIGAFVFSGSRIVHYQNENRYDADFTGTLVGLASFGSEVIAWPEPISPQASIDEPVWIADESTVPSGDVPVVIRITKGR